MPTHATSGTDRSVCKSEWFADIAGWRRECLYLCREIGVSTLLTDDLAVREVAKRLHLIAVGSLGIIVRAYRVGRMALAEAERHIIELYDISSLFVTRAIIELSIEQLRARSDKG